MSGDARQSIITTESSGQQGELPGIIRWTSSKSCHYDSGDRLEGPATRKRWETRHSRAPRPRCTPAVSPQTWAIAGPRFEGQPASAPVLRRRRPASRGSCIRHAATASVEAIRDCCRIPPARRKRKTDRRHTAAAVFSRRMSIVSSLLERSERRDGIKRTFSTSTQSGRRTTSTGPGSGTARASIPGGSRMAGSADGDAARAADRGAATYRTGDIMFRIASPSPSLPANVGVDTVLYPLYGRVDEPGQRLPQVYRLIGLWRDRVAELIAHGWDPAPDADPAASDRRVRQLRNCSPPFVAPTRPAPAGSARSAPAGGFARP